VRSFVALACYLKKTLGEQSNAAHVWTTKQLRSPDSSFNFPTVTHINPGSGTKVDFQAIELAATPFATLGPVAPPGINMAGTGVLTPNLVAEL
jgi:hypothetical protein